jgi:hypothetical protein
LGNSVEILGFNSPFDASKNVAVCSPEYYLNPNYFKSYSFISNRVYFLGAMGPQQVRPLTPSLPENIPPMRFISIVLIFNAVFIPLMILYKKMFKKTS